MSNAIIEPKKRGRAEAEAWRANPFYRLRLGDNGPDRIAHWGEDPRQGDPDRGREIVSGTWRIAAERLPNTVMSPWGEAPPSRHFAGRLHSFSWLSDLAALQNAQAAQKISMLIEAWVEAFGDWDDLAWDGELVAERLFAWLCHGRDAFERGDATHRPKLMRSVGRHARLLLIGAGDLNDHPQARFKAGAALVLAGIAGFPDADRLREAGEEILIEECAKQFLPDGAHQSRSPEALGECLSDLAAALTAYTRAKLDAPATLREAIVKFANMARLLRMGDGRFGCFQGGAEFESGAIDRAIEVAAGQVRPFRYATHAAFQKLEAGDVTLLFDVGGAPVWTYAERAHAGALAFEMSCGRERLIVNVGATADLEPEWRAAARTTAAHSTLIIGDALSSAQETRGRAPARFTGPLMDDVRRSEDDDGVTVQGRHDGYKAQYGLLHRRYLFVDHAGANVRGIEELIRPTRLKTPNPKGPIPFLVRFHLHPGVRSEMIEGQMVSLTLPSGVRWRMRTDATSVELQRSVYFGHGGAPLETTQIVFSGQADPMGHGLGPPNRVRWALARSV